MVKMFANHVSDKGLVSRIHKELSQLNNKMTKKKKLKNGQMIPQRYTMANKDMKRCSASLVIKKMQIETTVRYHFIPHRIVINKKRK